MKIRGFGSVIILFLFLLGKITFAQKERSVWYFGMLAGMKYEDNNYVSLGNNSIERQIVLGQIEGPDNIICANDQEGNLMFYSDGRIFKNRQHQNMLNAPTEEYALWESQAAVARDPGNPNRYYVFVTIMDGLTSRLTYTVVDMTLDNGLGGLVPNKKNIVITNNNSQLMTTARHANGKDIWLICLKQGTYRAYLITENGISTNYVGSDVGVSFVDGNAANFGVMEISPDNQLLAAGFPFLKRLNVLNFDNLTGRLSMVYQDEEEGDASNPTSFTGVEFSSNSRVLYTTNMLTGIQQYDLSDLENIPPRIDIVTGQSTYPYLKRGPDGTIFSIERGKEFIGAIQNPDVIGLGCNYTSNLLALSGSNLLDLPTFLMPKYPEGLSVANICEGEATEFNYNTSLIGATYTWELGDGNTANGSNVFHTYSDPGSYTVTVEVYDDRGNLTYSDTTEITVYPNPVINSLDNIYQCSEGTTVFFSDYDPQILNGLDSDIFGVSYYLSEEDALLRNNEIFEFTPDIGTLTIWVRLENRLNLTCFDVSSFEIITPEFIDIDIPREQYICNKNPLTLSAPDGFLSYEWSNGEVSQHIEVDAPGIYSLSVIKDFGDFTCEATTTISVRDGDEAPPIIEEIEIIDWSSNHNSIEVIIANDGAYEYSLDGINYQDSPQFLNLPLADYRVYVREKNCLQVTESDMLYLLYYDKFFTPNGDGTNDYWRVINNFREEDIEIQIFDRFGKLLEIMKYYDRGWDGTSNGVDMPASDYWFKVVRQNGMIHYGHFTLKR